MAWAVIGAVACGSVAVALAKEQGASGVILINTFPSLTYVAAWHYPWLPVRWLMRNRFNSLEKIRDCRCPVFVAHGGRMLGMIAIADPAHRGAVATAHRPTRHGRDQLMARRSTPQLAEIELDRGR